MAEYRDFWNFRLEASHEFCSISHSWACKIAQGHARLQIYNYYDLTTFPCFLSTKPYTLGSQGRSRTFQDHYDGLPRLNAAPRIGKLFIYIHFMSKPMNAIIVIIEIVHLANAAADP